MGTTQKDRRHRDQYSAYHKVFWYYLIYYFNNRSYLQKKSQWKSKKEEPKNQCFKKTARRGSYPESHLNTTR